jgi:hypothetical protein
LEPMNVSMNLLAIIVVQALVSSSHATFFVTL